MRFEVPRQPRKPVEISTFPVSRKMSCEFGDPFGDLVPAGPALTGPSVEEEQFGYLRNGTEIARVRLPLIETAVPIYDFKRWEVEEEWLSLPVPKQEKFPRFKQQVNLGKLPEPIEETEIPCIGFDEKAPSLARFDGVCLSDFKFDDQFYPCVVEDMPRDVTREFMFGDVTENCFPVFTFREQGSLLDNICCVQLEFKIQSRFPYEPMTKEWLELLDIDQSALNIIKSTVWDWFQEPDEMVFSLTPLEERLCRQEITIENQTNGITHSDTLEKIDEEVLPVRALPKTCEMNAIHFDSSDVGKFSTLFDSLEIICCPLCRELLLSVKGRLAVLLHLPNDPLSPDKLMEYCSAYSKVCVISACAPPFIATSVKWRYITSLGHISRAILPFLVEVNLE